MKKTNPTSEEVISRDAQASGDKAQESSASSIEGTPDSAKAKKPRAKKTPKLADVTDPKPAPVKKPRAKKPATKKTIADLAPVALDPVASQPVQQGKAIEDLPGVDSFDPQPVQQNKAAEFVANYVAPPQPIALTITGRIPSEPVKQPMPSSNTLAAFPALAVVLETAEARAERIERQREESRLAYAEQRKQEEAERRAAIAESVDRQIRESKERAARESAERKRREIKREKKRETRARFLAAAKLHGHKIGSGSTVCKRCGFDLREMSFPRGVIDVRVKCETMKSTPPGIAYAAIVQQRKAEAAKLRKAKRGLWKLTKRAPVKQESKKSKKKEGGK